MTNVAVQSWMFLLVTNFLLQSSALSQSSSISHWTNELHALHQHFPTLTSSTSSNSIIMDDAHDVTYLVNSPEVAKDYLSSFDTILFDCDGVLYRGSEPTPHAGNLIRWLMSQNKRVFFVTNNSGKTRQELCQKLSQLLKCPELTEYQMVGSAFTCAKYLDTQIRDINDSRRAHIYVIGSDSLCDEISRKGFVVVRDNDQSSGMTAEEIASISDDDHTMIAAVVVGLDTTFNYKKLSMATYHLRSNPNCLFIVTNEDAYDIVAFDRYQPGNGCLVSAIEKASDRKATCIGKPSELLLKVMVEEYGIHADTRKTLMVGDRIDTDIIFGRRGKLSTMAALTGCTTAQALIGLKNGPANQMPNVIVPYIGLALEC